MKNFSEFYKILRQKEKPTIYQRVLRAALFGSLLTFMVMGLVSVFGVFILRYSLMERSRSLSEKVGDYLEYTVENEVENHLMETTALKSVLVGRILKNCSLNVEYIANEMTEIIQNRENHAPISLPAANFETVPLNTPYLYYNPELLNKGISREIKDEIRYASSIEDELRRINRKFYTDLMVASERGYMIRMDTSIGEYKTAVLSNDPLKNSYTFFNREWYQKTKRENKLLFINQYMASYGKLCISVCAPYYYGEDFAGVVCFDLDKDYITKLIGNSHKGEKDFTFIMGSDGEIIISAVEKGVFAIGNEARDLRKSSDAALSETAKRMTAGDTGLSVIKADDTVYYLAYTPVPDTEWSIGAIANKEDITKSGNSLETYVNRAMDEYNENLNALFLIITLVAFGIFVIVLYLIIKENVRMAKGFAAPILLLTEGAQEIAKGNLDKKLDIKTGDEIETLSENFNTMTQSLAKYMKNLEETTAVNERINTELSVATKIQAGMLPKITEEFKERSEFSLFAFMKPAKEVGGDFYDFYMLDRENLVITIADVSGKGVPAALFMVIAKTMLKENLLFAGLPEKLADVFNKTNDSLVESNEANMFVTLFTGIVNIVTGKFTYANAGHNPPIIKTKDETKYLPVTKNPIMGALEGLKYKTATLALSPGDSLFFYTDGVTEARQGENDMFGEGRLLKLIEETGLDAEKDIKAAYLKIKEYANNTPQSDDITMAEFIFKGNIKSQNI